MHSVVVLQRDACGRAGSRLYETILDAIADDIVAGGTCASILAPWSANAMADAVPLRFLASVHHLVLTGAAPELAAYFPSAGGDRHDDPRAAFLDAVETHRSFIEESMARGVQTNEVGRAATLVGAFHLVAARTGLPLRLLEIGASAGLLMRWDQFGYRVGSELRWGRPDGVVFDDPWVDAVPSFEPELRVASRRGCDVAPIDPTTEEGVGRLRSFVWPDQTARRRQLDRAIDVAERVPARVDRADAGAWAAAHLADRAPGVATVVYHSIVLQYLPRPSFEAMRSAILAAGARATPDAPVHWLRMEPAGEVADLRLRSWTGEREPIEEVLATSGYHGAPVRWELRS